jgi:hypothetical protein
VILDRNLAHVDGKPISGKQKYELAVADGFRSLV